jgi:hypothetical protein
MMNSSGTGAVPFAVVVQPSGMPNYGVSRREQGEHRPTADARRAASIE